MTASLILRKLGWEHVNLTGDYTWHTNNGWPKALQAASRRQNRLKQSLAYVNFPFLSCPH